MTEPETQARDRLLVVEDDPPLRQLIVRTLERQGFAVLEAPNGAAALELVQAGTSIALLITDVVMPHMDGFDLVSRVTQLAPQTRVLFISGEAEQSVAVRGGLKELGFAFLQKPFTRDELVQTIDVVLARVRTTEPGSGETGGPSAPPRPDEPGDRRDPPGGRSAARPAPPAPTPPADTGPVPEAPTVLVVDDEPSMRTLMMRYLDADRYRVVQAACAREAIETMRRTPVAVALCDINLQGKDGLWLARQIRRNRPDTAVILVTGAPAVESAVSGLRNGVRDYLHKPLDRRELRVAVADGVEHHRLMKATRAWVDATPNRAAAPAHAWA